MPAERCREQDRAHRQGQRSGDGHNGLCQREGEEGGHPDRGSHESQENDALAADAVAEVATGEAGRDGEQVGNEQDDEGRSAGQST